MIVKEALSTSRVSRYIVYLAGFFLDNIERINIDDIGHMKFYYDALKEMLTNCLILKFLGKIACFKSFDR